MCGYIAPFLCRAVIMKLQKGVKPKTAVLDAVKKAEERSRNCRRLPEKNNLRSLISLHEKVLNAKTNVLVFSFILNLRRIHNIFNSIL